MSDLNNAMDSAASGMRAQATRMRIISENLANARSTGDTPGEDPYRRQIPLFGDMVDRESGARTVEVRKVAPDMAEFGLKFDPNHPAADDKGYIKVSNVNPLIEMMDMREAQRSYEANLNAMNASRRMATSTLELLR